MKILEELEHFDLSTASQAEVADVIDRLKNQVQKDAKLIHYNQAKIQALTHELAYRKRIQFSAKTETLSAIQRDLFEECLNTDVGAMEAELEELKEDQLSQTVARPKRVRAGRQPLPEHLPRIEHRHEPESCTCDQCGKALVKIGEDITEQLDVEPAKFFVHRHIRSKYACKVCETITAEPVPPAIIDGGMAAVGLLTWVMISKFQDHLPLYRLEQMATREQVSLSRSTLADWVGRVGVALQPLVDRLTWHLLQGNTLHADETPVSQLEPGNGKTKKAYLWAYRSNDLFSEKPRIIVFEYQTGRSGEHVRHFLGNWSGHLMVDDYAGYKALFAQNTGCTELACFAHARRKFFDLHQANQSSMALLALQQIAELYAIEDQGKALNDRARQQLRQEQALPKLQSFYEWLTQIRIKTANGGASAKAIDYTLKRWDALTRYAQTGHLPIDNNPVENCIRPIAVGKKNWLFAGSERAGRRAAAIQTLIGTANLNGLNPAHWLRDTLEKLPTWPYSRIDELLPFTSEQIEMIKQNSPIKN